METKEDAAVTAWTPGPWYLDTYQGARRGIDLADIHARKSGAAICKISSAIRLDGVRQEAAYANARLIAAAPDLAGAAMPILEALEAIMRLPDASWPDGFRPLVLLVANPSSGERKEITQEHVIALRTALTRAGGA